MDYFVNHWQQIVSLMIVASTIVLMVRAELHSRKNKKDCGNCAILEIKNRQQYSLRNHS